jgi:hypothetical protein
MNLRKNNGISKFPLDLKWHPGKTRVPFFYFTIPFEWVKTQWVKIP